ncbi:MAG: hypothetical protein H6867_06770 [Rhodospirillales bacterium]|nr:hypothetical protein [Rhodospirillales bacterium]MCB9995252.1 hypothetical protein [Rhodospirillales bacterium]
MNATTDQKICRTASRLHYPFQFLKSASEYQFEESRRRWDSQDPLVAYGWIKFKAAGFVFLAFWVESYLNYCLENIYSASEYDALERLSPKKKAELIAEKLNVKYADYKSVVNELFKFRDSLAHGKKRLFDEIQDNTMTLEKFHTAGESLSEFADLERYLQTFYEQYLNKDSKNTVKLLEELLDHFYLSAQFQFHPCGVSDLTSFSASS